MTHFSPDPLSTGTAAALNRLQNVVNAETTGERAYNRAADLWKNRKNRAADKILWDQIEQQLADKHPLSGICQYCEFDRTTATEHFFPKKHFPGKTFDWNNYLLVCHRCNSNYKGDKFAVFHPGGSSTVHHLPNVKGVYTNPPNDDAVLINPRRDKPQDYLMLDLGTGIFLPVFGVDNRGRERARYTCNTLSLNADSNLLRYRKKALIGYLNKLSTYVKVKQATNMNSLLNAFSNTGRTIVVQTNTFTTEQSRLLDVVKADLLDDLFPCAWMEIKLQKGIDPAISALFTAAPEALNW